MMQSNWLYWEWSLLVLDVDNGIEAEDGIWYLCSISIVSIDHWPVDIQSPACSQRYLLCLLDSRKRRLAVIALFWFFIFHFSVRSRRPLMTITAALQQEPTDCTAVWFLSDAFCHRDTNVWTSQSIDQSCACNSLCPHMLCINRPPREWSLVVLCMPLCTDVADLWSEVRVRFSS